MIQSKKIIFLFCNYIIGPNISQSVERYLPRLEGSGRFNETGIRVCGNYSGIKLAYGSADDSDSIAETGATFIAAGLDHALSKRTAACILYAATHNDAGATYGLGQAGAGGAYKPAADEDPSVVSIGLNFTF